MGTGESAGAFRPRRLAVSKSDGTDLSHSLCFIWCAGAGIDRQSRNPAAIRIRRRRQRTARPGALLAVSDGVLAEPERFRDSGHKLGGCDAVAAAHIRHHAARQLATSLRALPLDLLCRTDLHGLSVGRALTRNRLPYVHSEHGYEARHLAAALANVPIHVSF